MSMLRSEIWQHRGRPCASAALLTLLSSPLVVLPGCRMTPRYTPPQIMAPAAYKEMSSVSGSTVSWVPAQPLDGSPRNPWWLAFGDEDLNSLETQADVSNQSLAAAYANYNAARAIVREMQSHYLPTITTSAGVNTARVSVFPGLNPKSGFGYTEYSLPVEATWVPDLWGAIRNDVHSAAFTGQAQGAAVESARLAIHAQLAMNYILLRSEDSLNALLDATIASQRQTLDVTNGLVRAGLATDEAVSAAEAQLRATEAQRDAAQLTRAQYEHAIALLVGKAPADLTLAARPLAVVLPEVPAGVPSALLQRRPDIASAARTVAAANAQIGIASSAFFPKLTLSGSMGFTALSAADWLTWPSRVWALGPVLAETVFDGGLRRATESEYRARVDASAATYRQTVLTAFQQVEDALAATQMLKAERTNQDAAVTAAARTFTEAQVRYRSELDPYLNVLQAQETVLNYQQVSVQLEAQQANATVQLIQALGGGWDTARLPTYKDLSKK